MVACDVAAVVQLTHALLPPMIERGRGGVINVASTISFQPAPYQALYRASNAFVLSFSQALWAKTHGTGVTVTALCPGPTRTGFVDALGRTCRRRACTADSPNRALSSTPRCGPSTVPVRSP